MSKFTHIIKVKGSRFPKEDYESFWERYIESGSWVKVTFKWKDRSLAVSEAFPYHLGEIFLPTEAECTLEYALQYLEEQGHNPFFIGDRMFYVESGYTYQFRRSPNFYPLSRFGG